jgi:hypothetical protein
LIQSKLRALWRRITTSRYTRALENEVMLLRAENRALLNSILGIAGVPPIPVPEMSANGENRAATPTRARVRSLPRPRDPIRGAQNARSVPLPSIGGAKASDGAAADSAAESATASGDAAPSIAVPMRRRSWQQINRMLEFESARKKREA